MKKMIRIDYYSDKEVKDLVNSASLYKDGVLVEVKVELLKSLLNSGRLKPQHMRIISGLIVIGRELNPIMEKYGVIPTRPLVEGVKYQIYSN